MSWKEALKADPSDWLLEPQDPCVRFWALQDLEGKASNDPEVLEAQVALMVSSPVSDIIDAQESEGYWVHREDMYLPKYKATTHSLLILAELGAMMTPAIEVGLEHVFKFQRRSGHFLTTLPKSDKGRASIVKDGCCFDANVLYYMVHFGYLEDPRVRARQVGNVLASPCSISLISSRYSTLSLDWELETNVWMMR
jgi:hypothetical protein